jgi:hypothetical protein
MLAAAQDVRVPVGYTEESVTLHSASQATFWCNQLPWQALSSLLHSHLFTGIYMGASALVYDLQGPLPHRASIHFSALQVLPV